MLHLGTLGARVCRQASQGETAALEADSIHGGITDTDAGQEHTENDHSARETHLCFHLLGKM